MKTHLVHNLNLQIPASNYEKAREIQRYAESWTKNEFPILLNKSLDEISKEDEILFLDKIEIEIPELPWTLTEQQWKKKIQTEISNSNLIKLPFEIIFKEWLFFIENGSFQNGSIFKDKKEIENYFFKHLDELKSNSTILIVKVFNSIHRIKRLFHNFSAKLVEGILAQSFFISKVEGSKLYVFLEQKLKNTNEKNQEIIENIIFILQNAENKKKGIQLLEILAQQAKERDVEKESLNQQKKENFKKEKEQPETNENIYINCPNAGMVILLPYFQPLLENLEMLKDKQFKNENSHLNGVQIVQFLATGKENFEEENLVLPKLLCGFELHDFISINEPLEESIKKECLLLLQSVIEHWAVLKNTSIDSLRASFLQRNGRLKIEEQQYLLEVENSGVDVLLDKIPWGFRNYKLPWMNKSIVTEWY